jgi:hypothetical protein
MDDSYEKFLEMLKSTEASDTPGTTAASEPSAEMLGAAQSISGLFNAFMRAGFTRQEAFTLVIAGMQSAGGSGG